MKQFLSFVQKEFHHIFRDRRTMLILLGMPIVQIILFGFAITTEVKNVKVAVLDYSKDISTRQIIDKLDASEYFDVRRILQNSNETEETFKRGEADLIVVFEPNFENNLRHTGQAKIQLIADATDPNNATILTGYATSIITDYQQSLAAHPISIQIIPQVKLLYNPGMQSAYNFVPGVMGLILMLICAMMTSISIVREKETGTMEVLLVSPVRPLMMIIAKMVPYFFSVLHQSDNHSAAVCICASCPGRRKSAFAGFPFMDIHYCIFIIRVAGIHHRQDTSRSHAVLGYGTDDAYSLTFGHDISCREYAAAATDYL